MAAGQSKRFGTKDKLAQLLGDTMLGVHICDALKTLGCAHSIVVTSSAQHPCASAWRDRGFELVVNPDSDKGLSGSVAIAARVAQHKKADALLLCLADMPFVTTGHLRALIDRCDMSDSSSVIASHNGQAASPPAIFGADHFSELAGLDGDSGAKHLLIDAVIVASDPKLLRDIDTAEHWHSVIDQ